MNSGVEHEEARRTYDPEGADPASANPIAFRILESSEIASLEQFVIEVMAKESLRVNQKIRRLRLADPPTLTRDDLKRLDGIKISMTARELAQMYYAILEASR
jgi:hypothetical protein